MSSSEQERLGTKWNIDGIIRHIYIDEIIFLLLVFLCFFGEILIEVSGRIGIFYWLLMTPIFCFCSILSEKVRGLAVGHEIKHLIKYQAFYWGSAFTAVLLVFLTWHAEVINAGAAGIITHIILAHTLFLSGITLGFRFYLIGAFLFCTAGLSILMEAHFGIDLLLGLPFVWLGFYMEKTHIFPTLKRRTDFVKRIIGDDADSLQRRVGDE